MVQGLNFTKYILSLTQLSACDFSRITNLSGILIVVLPLSDCLPYESINIVLATLETRGELARKSVPPFFLGSLLGTLRSIDADGNENIKKTTIGFISKTTTSHVHHNFLYISFLFLFDFALKMPNFTFYGGRKQARTKFYVSF